MNGADITFVVFTKPWKTPLAELARFVKGLGFDGIELPVRPGFQVEPQDIARKLPEAARILGDAGLSIASVAGPTDETTIAACAAAGVPLIRICVDIPAGSSYLAHEAHLQRELEVMVPVLERYGVAIGIQNHCDRFIANAMGIRHLIEQYNPTHVGAVLDFAHCALNGEIPALALDITWSHLRMVNLKNAYWQRTTGPEAPVAAYKHYWTSGRQGLCSWETVAGELKKRGYAGPLCLTAEYSDEAAVDRLIADDIIYARSLFEEPERNRYGRPESR